MAQKEGATVADPGGPLALATAGGKDAVLALHRARRSGWVVSHALNVFEGTTGLIRFHGVPEMDFLRQVGSLGLEAVTDHTHPRDFEAVFLELLERLKGEGVVGLVFGNIHLADVREWYQERVESAGLQHLEPLWGEDPGKLVREFLREGYRTRVVSVSLERGDPAWLGRELTLELVESIERAGADPCGEFGEYHTFVFDGPDFRDPVDLAWDGVREMEGHRFLDLLGD